MCVSGAGRGRMSLIWLAAVILELSSRSRPPAERGSAPVEQGREGGCLAWPLRARDWDCGVRWGLRCDAIAQWRESMLTKQEFGLASVIFVFWHTCLSHCMSQCFSLSDKHTHTGARWQLSDHMLRKTHTVYGCCLNYGHFYVAGIYFYSFSFFEGYFKMS